MSSSVKHTLERLEEQQKQRLLKKKKKEENEKAEVAVKNVCKCSVEDQYDNFDGVEDELDLKLGIKFSNLMETDDFKELQEGIRELKDENGRLNKLLGEREEEIKIIRRRWKEDKRDLTGGGIGSDNVAAKIIEFSKKIRDLNAELGKEKSKTLNLQRQVDQFELQKKTQEKSMKSPTKEERDKEASELSSVKDKLSQVLLKSAEERNEIDSLKKELKIANKVLQREVGENISFQSLLNSSAGWRGRQQQIMALQQKNNDLQQQLPQHERGKSGSTSRSISSHGQSVHDEKHRLTMRKMELERKEQADKLQKELEATVQERNSLKEKNNATRARIKILSQDNKNLKEQMSTLIEKGKHDDELVSALLKEQQILKADNEKLKKSKQQENSQKGERVLRASGNFAFEEKEQHHQSLVDKLKEEMAIQENKVVQLESELKEIKTARRSQSHIPRPPGSAAGRRNDPRRPYSGSSVPSTDTIDQQLQEFKSLNQAAGVEVERLNGLVKLLQDRNGELVKDSLEKTIQINERKHQNAQLEKELEKTLLSQRNNKKASLSPRKTDPAKDLLEMETKLNIQLENNDALKEALNAALESKEEDLKVFHQMVEETKKIFLQGLRQYRSNAVSSAS
ncbi:coiled-coil domain-containing protein 13-like [Clytia hemisphaerica]|uniref:coiled-coil domain-containing protein 13-like n=1 Tax=Clytia hemisphaerica TaxID=252671 RepID=UPI0034D3AA74